MASLNTNLNHQLRFKLILYLCWTLRTFSSCYLFSGTSRYYAAFQNSNTSVDLLSHKSSKLYSSGGFAHAPPTLLRPVDRHVTVILRLMFEQLLHGSQGRWRDGRQCAARCRAVDRRTTPAQSTLRLNSVAPPSAYSSSLVSNVIVGSAVRRVWIAVCWTPAQDMDNLTWRVSQFPLFIVVPFSDLLHQSTV